MFLFPVLVESKLPSFHLLARAVPVIKIYLLKSFPSFRSRKGGSAVRQMFLSPEEADKARAPTVTDDVISCRFSRHLPNRVLVVQRARAQGTSLEFLARAYEYRESEVGR